jgi:hypothetical protein
MHRVEGALGAKIEREMASYATRSIFPVVHGL